MKPQIHADTRRSVFSRLGKARGSSSAFICVHLRLPVVLVLIALVAMAGSAVAGQDAALARVYREGERLVYDITWLSIKAGEATLEAQGLVQLNGQRAYHLVTTARSGPVISKFYRVDDRTESYLALNPMRTLRFDKHLREGRYRHSSQTLFDHERGVATFRHLDFSQVPRTAVRPEEAERYGKYLSEEYPLTPGALDELSVLYYVRTLPLRVGATVGARVFASKKNWELEVKVLGRETLETVLGFRETLVVEPLLKFEGIFQRKGRVVVWITDDAERIPVQMQSEIKIGSFVARLTRREAGQVQADLGASGRVTR